MTKMPAAIVITTRRRMPISALSARLNCCTEAPRAPLVDRRRAALRRPTPGLFLEPLAAVDDEGDGLLDVEALRLGLDHRRHRIDEGLLLDGDHLLELGFELVQRALLRDL